MRFVLLVVAILIAPAALAEAEGIPKVVRDHLNKQAKACNLKVVTVPDSSLKVLDFNADGVPDYIVSYENVCSAYCGASGGCAHDFWLSSRRGHAIVRTETFQGVKRIEHRATGDVAHIETHGSVCGQVGAVPCSYRVNFFGGKLNFTPTPKVKGKPWIGKWYRGNVSECRQDPTQNDKDTLIYEAIYEADSMSGYEFSCLIVAAKPSGAAHRLTLSCSQEGRSVREREIVEVVDGYLKRTTFVNKKPLHLIFRRCPD